MLPSIPKPLALLALLGVVGCGDSGQQEPAKFVAQEPAAEMPAKEAVPSPTLSEGASLDLAVEPATLQTDVATDGTIPPVLLTNQHEALCRVKVGDAMPEISLPQVSGGTAKLSAMYGKAATVVVFWKGDRAMSIQELSDLGYDVVQPYGSRGVKVIGVAVEETPATARETIKKTAANFPQLLDADGQGFAKVGAKRLPWTLVLDPSGKIVWFDLEYSLTTRRELQQALLALVN